MQIGLDEPLTNVCDEALLSQQRAHDIFFKPAVVSNMACASERCQSAGKRQSVSLAYSTEFDDEVERHPTKSSQL